MDIPETCLLKTQKKKESDFQICTIKGFIKSENNPTEDTESLFKLRLTWWAVL